MMENEVFNEWSHIMHLQSEQMSIPLVFWQPSLSPHQSPLLEQLVLDWPAPVHLVVDYDLASNRQKSYGWQVERPKGIVLNTRGSQAPSKAIHIVSGFYGTKLWRENFRRIMRDNDAVIWVMAESLETWDNPLRVISRFLRHGFSRLQIGKRLSGFLAIGQKAESQARMFGVPLSKIHPFCYVTSPPGSAERPATQEGVRATVLFLGGVLKRKGVDVLFRTPLPNNSMLRIVGPHVDKKIAIPNDAEHLGIVANSEVSDHIREADLLVLPSRHDGWGAVINEALTVGTPVVCTAACGGSVLLGSRSPFRGEIIHKLNPDSLSKAIANVLNEKIDHDLIIEWSKERIYPVPVSNYLTELLSGSNSTAPWMVN